MKRLSKGIEALTVEDERREILAAYAGAAGPRLKREQPQKVYRRVNDVPVHTGWLEMLTIVDDFYDGLGRNRKGSTFGPAGLAELGIDSAKCEII